MNILVIAATTHELAFKRSVNVETLITGVGIPATIYHLQKKLQQNSYKFVIQAGIAGAFSNEFNLGQTVLVKQDCFGDLGTEEKGLFNTIFEAGLEDKNTLPYKNGWLYNNNDLLKNSELELVKAVTINKVSDSVLQKQQLLQTYNPEIETMEGAAFHYVCLQENIPFVQIRSISNYVGERDKSKWKMADAISSLSTEIELLIKELS
ncbi:futalosine hydrolase [Ferruginibacter sp. SUN002]|uniref:futalosine hydrolase n=1 Tax=Ferruginibacter sp. SUN002 TaxID=2937789 RepID=UPI003D36A7FE